MGFMQATLNIARTSELLQVANVGHVFGRWGMGEATMPDVDDENGNPVDNLAFQWAASAANAHTMMINLLPVNPTDSGISAGMNV